MLAMAFQSSVWQNFCLTEVTFCLTFQLVRQTFMNTECIADFVKSAHGSHQENMSVKCLPPSNPTFIEKLGYAGVYLYFLFLLQNIDCGEAVLTCTHNLF